MPEDIYEIHNALKRRTKALYWIIGGLVLLLLAGGIVTKLLEQVGTWPLVIGAVGVYAIYHFTRPKEEQLYDIAEKINKATYKLDGHPSLGDIYKNVTGMKIGDIQYVRYGGKEGRTYHYNVITRRLQGIEHTNLEDIQKRIDTSRFLQSLAMKEQTQRIKEEQLERLGFK